MTPTTTQDCQSDFYSDLSTVKQVKGRHPLLVESLKAYSKGVSKGVGNVAHGKECGRIVLRSIRQKYCMYVWEYALSSLLFYCTLVCVYYSELVDTHTVDTRESSIVQLMTACTHQLLSD